MSAIIFILYIIFIGITGAFGWAMRGTIIGGEKGGILPGALLGLCIASLNLNVYGDIFPFIACAGAFGMFHGGSCTYGETLNFVLRSNGDDETYKGKFRKGMTGVAINGGNWFSLAAYFMSITLQSTCGITQKYGRTEILIMLILVPIIQIIGELIFNHPYSKEKKIYPKIYFSVTRREEWGSNLLLIFVAMVYSLIKGDFFSLLALIFGYISGASGFMLGLYLYYKNVKDEFFGSLQRKGYIGNWKMMEMTIGFVGFIGVSLYFHFAEILLNLTDYKTDFTPSENFVLYDFSSVILLVAYILLLVFTAVYGKVTKKEFSDHISDILMRPLFSVLPLLFVILSGSEKTAYISLMAITGFVMLEKCFNGYLKKLKAKYFILSLLILWVISSVIYAFKASDISIFALSMMLILPYQITALIENFNLTELKTAVKNEGIIKHFKSSFTTEVVMTVYTVISFIGFYFITKQ